MRAINSTVIACAADSSAGRRWFEALPELVYGRWRELDFGVFRRLRQAAEPVERYCRDEAPRQVAETCHDQDSTDSVFVHLHAFFSRGLGEPTHFHPSGPLPEYAFVLPPGRRIVFERAKAGPESSSPAAADQASLRWTLHDECSFEFDERELRVAFELRPVSARTKQVALNRAVCRTLLQQPELADWRNELRQNVSPHDEKTRSRLEWHMDRFTHWQHRPLLLYAGLAETLNRALDDYLHRELFDLDALHLASVQQLETRLIVAQLVRDIAQRVIAWLDRRERFVTDLWLAPRRVTETDYCLTLDRVPAEMYPEVALNSRQLAAWRTHLALDELRPAAERDQPPSVEFLQKNPFLVLDTQFFDDDFRERLLSGIAEPSAACDGVIVHGENAQALRLLKDRYAGQVKCIAIDPPYNTGTEAWTYTDRFDRNDWSLMMEERLALARELLRDDGAIFVMLDDHELPRLRLAMDRLFGADNFLATLVWEKVHTRKNSAKHFSVSHDYLPVYARDKARWRRNLLPREETDAYANPDADPRGPWKPDPVYANKPYSADYQIRKPNGAALSPPPGRYWRFSERNFLEKVERGEVLWGQGDAYPLVKRYLADVQDGLVPVTLLTRKFAGDNALAAAELQALFGEGRPVTYPKPSRLIERLLQIATHRAEDDLVLDFFAGSGTTAQAVINQNRADGGRRKYILVEQADYFDTVLKQRIIRTVYSRDWQQGRPVSRSGVSHMLQVVRLETFEQAVAAKTQASSPAARKQPGC